MLRWVDGGEHSILDILYCVLLCCSVLQCVALCCSVLQCVAVYTQSAETMSCCSVLQDAYQMLIVCACAYQICEAILC